MTDVVKLADHADDNRMWTVEQMLEAALTEVREGKVTGGKAVLIVLDTGTDGLKYDTQSFYVDVSAAELVALTGIMQSRFIQMVEDGE